MAQRKKEKKKTVPAAAASLDEPQVVEGVKLLTFCCCRWSCCFSFAFECALFRLVMKITPLARVVCECQLASEPRNVASGWMSERPRGEFHTRCVGMND